MPMHDILNYIQMTEKIGTSGQPTREQFEQIARAEYKAVVNLSMPDAKNAIADEGAVVAGLGMQYVHIPVPFNNPTAAHLKRFIRIMQALDGDKVWVHCAVNARVSAFMYQYLRLEKGYDAASAKNILLQSWEPKMEPVWTHFIRLSAADLS